MTTTKVALTLSSDVLMLAKKRVRAGHAKSLSSLVSDAVDEKLRRDELRELLDAMDDQHGKPGKAARTWARRVLARSS
jgi:hypothetical protein